MVIPTTPQRSPNLRKIHNFAGYTNSPVQDHLPNGTSDDVSSTGGDLLGLLTDMGDSRNDDPYLCAPKMRNLTPIKKRFGNRSSLPKKSKPSGPKERGKYCFRNINLMI